MKSILSIFSFLSLSISSSLAEEACKCDCTLEELKIYTDLASASKQNLDACEFKVEKAQKILDIYQGESKDMSDTMSSMNDADAAKDKRRKEPETWADEKQNLIDDLNEKEEELYDKIRKYDKQEKAMKKQIMALKKEIEALKKQEL
jgi:chromosome segregation ATPase